MKNQASERAHSALRLNCPFCGLAFGLEEAADSCGACPVRRLAKVCGGGLARCPRCGYESPLPPRWAVRRTHGTE